MAVCGDGERTGRGLKNEARINKYGNGIKTDRGVLVLRLSPVEHGKGKKDYFVNGFYGVYFVSRVRDETDFLVDLPGLK